MVSVVPGSGANSRVWKRDIEHAVVVDDIGHMNIPELDKDLTLFKNQKLICKT